ncbi:NINE protein [Nocardioides sp. dk4132]|uniref:TM2 domain-containing protein n=1 Tax=unclassified Nocardioides TaxID=2615069 RepID=UPI0012972530|nr:MULTISPECIES: TM2 domain-containing protein [unclassified Nocardioides]MQW75438.1 NINE protein [Nocardioides sp. dk4132]QGA08361.1 NINE protein [Nocardioides sp. dk884]
MTQGPEYPRPEDDDQSSPYGQQPYGQEPYAQQPPPPYGQQPPGYGQAYPPYGGVPGAVPGAPYGVHPTTGIPYSEKSKLVAGLLQLLLPLGIGRLYAGYTGIGIAQLVVTIVTCGIGALWPFIDGIIILATDSKDAEGYMLRS